MVQLGRYEPYHCVIKTNSDPHSQFVGRLEFNQSFDHGLVLCINLLSRGVYLPNLVSMFPKTIDRRLI